ncbi:glycosyltransferase [Flavobacterium branchiophilum]|uniref:Glycosyl transferase family 2 n=1 Tax=Flavobacterium branchiophilum TaxID=55197 RepID=A0A543G0V1_9FLAO|nr:glycosyltransferase [Flavobacterium branchiophilum]OXA77445.1 glycosyltransferase [Flavobacterium branchiophilum] [Flavobacterium branchiophilum NBRC 15030 = ATCC 35035]TQM39716.1 glycosyl transferase family 2 [Flavobacterium branchiophilum]GEM55617.1 glycosyl transferase [Flavobacterium branchiophilum NBRC 15030 = ATCC 35035]
MQDFPLVTVVCMCYNHAPFVVACLNSVLFQTYPHIELIIVDDCSTDQSVAVIQNWLVDYPKIKFIKNEKNIGCTRSFNKAVAFAEGDYLIDLAADDLLQPCCVALQIKKFQTSKYDNLGIVYGNVALIDANGQFLSYFYEVDEHLKRVVKAPTGLLYKELVAGDQNVMCSVSGMVKRSVFDALHGYDEQLQYEDLDFWIRVSRDYNIDFIDAILVQKRVLQHSLGAQFVIPKNNLSDSTYLILQKTFQLNRNKSEHRHLQKRVHYEIVAQYKISNWALMLRYVVLRIKIEMKVFINIY